MQISAPVQPGNSGGPVIDKSGNIIGVVVSKLDAVRAAELTGDIPQNVNFAVQFSIVMSLLDSFAIKYDTSVSERENSTSQIVAESVPAIVPLECVNSVGPAVVANPQVPRYNPAPLPDPGAPAKVPSDKASDVSGGWAAYNQGDYRIAFAMLQKPAQDGDGLAQYYLGMMYLKGQGPPKNVNLGFEWLSKAALAGCADAQAYMGSFNRRGFIVPQNFTESMRWYLLAAKQNHENSQYRIALMYYTGEGVQQNLKEAYMWAVISSAGGEPEPNQLRMKLEKSLSASEIAEGQRNAALWRTTNILPK
jgi:hypothetical protein